MGELVALSPPGTFIELPNVARAGVKDMTQALHNLLEVGIRITRAMDKGCYIEVLTLRSQWCEFFLRLYLAAKHHSRHVSADDRRPLGALLSDAEGEGLDPGLAARLRDFNADRVSGVHHYLLGSADYESLADLGANSQHVVMELAQAVASSVGRPFAP